MSKPKILFISFSWPRGRSFGGQIRALGTGRALKKLGHVDLLVVSADAAEEQRIESAEEFNVVGHIRPVSAPHSSLQKLRRAFDTSYLNIHGSMASTADRDRILALRDSYNLVWIFHSRAANMLPIWRWNRTHLDIDDVPSTYYRTLAENGKSTRERLSGRIQQRLLQRRERLLLKRFITLSVCSEPDKQYLGADERIHVIPNGFERPAVEPNLRKEVSPPRIGFIGLYSYAPNREGVEWFLHNCWPQIRQQIPGIRFRLIGKDTDGPLKPTAPDVDALGWIADPADEIATWSTVITPILSGGGTRIKIADAFSRKCPVVSTSLGAFGYEVLDGQDLLLADNPSDFARACVALATDHKRGTALAENAWRKFLDNWTWDAIAPKVWAAAEHCLRLSRLPVVPPQ